MNIEEIQKKTKGKKIALWGVEEIKDFIKLLELPYSIFQLLSIFSQKRLKFFKRKTA